ncbi:MAG: DUF4837 family protein [Flavobacteriaceae bacterium]|nr:DUF4837 family protein [Flavobacteriaceae bacterium]
MKKGLTFIAVLLFLISCKDAKETFVLSTSVGQSNQLLVVTEASDWKGEIGDNLRKFLGKLVVGLPQPETTFSVTQIAPKGFGSMMNKFRNILFVQIGEKEAFFTKNDFYAKPQTLVYVTAKDKESLNAALEKHKKEIVKIFRDSEIKVLQSRFENIKLDDSQYKTFKKLGISLTIPKTFRTVYDTGDFVWLRQHLMSGIAQGDGTNNILVYSFPLNDEFELDPSNSIINNRNTIGEKYVRGADTEKMYMITEAAFTPQTLNAKVASKKAYETRGKWEVKNDFMAGPFLNYTIVDKKNNRLLVVEGFTYAPSVDKRDFVFELEAIAKSIQIK